MTIASDPASQARFALHLLSGVIMQIYEPISAFNAHAFGPNEFRSSAVSWGAVAGGALVSAALGLALLALGAGLGFASISPWTSTGASATAIGIANCALAALLTNRTDF